MEEKINIMDLVAYGWDTFKTKPAQHVLVLVATVIASYVAGLLVEFISGNNPIIYLALNLTELLTIEVFVNIFLISYAILQTRKSDKSVQDILSSIFDFDLWWKYTIVVILGAIATILGLIFLVVPGVIIGIGIAFAVYYVIDYKDNPIDALKKSWELTNGYKMKLFLLFLLLGALNLLGLAALFVGLLVTVPVSMFTVAHVYNILTEAYGDEQEGFKNDDRPSSLDDNKKSEQESARTDEEAKNTNDAETDLETDSGNDTVKD